MRNFYSNPEEYTQRGIDYDLHACLEFNPQSFDVDDIERVAAVWEGERDADNWRWVLQFKDGRAALLIGGCDYTGWDCQSHADTYWRDSLEECADFAGAEEYTYDKEQQKRAISADLRRQLAVGKESTWREKKDAEFGLR